MIALSFINSKNVINAIKKANQMEMVTIGFSGNDGGIIKIYVNTIEIIQIMTANLQSKPFYLIICK